MNFDTRDILAFLLAIFAFLSAIGSLMSAFAARRAVTRNLRPVLVFVRDESTKIWLVKNVGMGPALDVVVAEERSEGKDVDSL